VSLRAFHHWTRSGARGLLFVNLSAVHVVHYAQTHGTNGIHDLLRSLRSPAGQLVVNLCDHESLPNLSSLLWVKRVLHDNGVLVSLAEASQGRPALLAWESLQPDFAWLGPMCFEASRPQRHVAVTVRALQQLCESLGIRLIANGIDTPDQALFLRDIGIAMGQGKLFGLGNNDSVNGLLPSNPDEAAAAHTHTHTQATAFLRNNSR
jgi:diguanylate cyclase